MPIYKIQAPDGSILKIEGPEGATDEQLTQAAAAGYQSRPQTEPKKELPFGVQTAANIGAGLVRGAGSIGATLAGLTIDPLARATGLDKTSFGESAGLGKTMAERRQGMDDAFKDIGVETNSMGYGGGKLASEVAGTLGVGGAIAPAATALKAAPALVSALRTGGMTAGGATGVKSLAPRMFGGAVTGGAATALINPEDAAMGAAIGAAIPGVGMGASALGKALRTAPDPALEQIIQNAAKFDIPVGVGDVTRNRALKAAQSVLNDAPITGSMAANATEAKQAAFNKAIGGQFGSPEPKLTVGVIDAAKGRMGAEFDRIWKGNTLEVSPTMIQTMQELEQQAAKLPKHDRDSLKAEIADLFTQMKPDANGALQIEGEAANKFQSWLRRRVESSSGLKNELGDLRQSIIKTFNESVSPADAASLTLNRTQYKAFKTIEPLLNSAEAGVAGRMPGDVPAALFPAAVAKNYRAGSEMGDLSQVGSQFLVDRVAKTGGSTRAAIQNSLLGAALYGGGGIPAMLAAAPVAIGAQKMLQSSAFQKFAGKQDIEPLLRALRTSTTYGAPALTSQ